MITALTPSAGWKSPKAQRSSPSSALISCVTLGKLFNISGQLSKDGMVSQGDEWSCNVKNERQCSNITWEDIFSFFLKIKVLKNRNRLKKQLQQSSY